MRDKFDKRGQKPEHDMCEPFFTSGGSLRSEAFGCVVRSFRDRLVGYAHKRGWKLPQGQLQDMASEAAVKVWKMAIEGRIDGLKAANSVRDNQKVVASLLWTGLESAKIDEGRRAQARYRRAPKRKAMVASIRAQNRSQEMIQSDDWLSEIREPLRSAIADLDPKFRVPLMLKGFGDLTQDEIAERLGIPRQTVGSRIYRAAKKIRAAIPDADRDQMMRFLRS